MKSRLLNCSFRIVTEKGTFEVVYDVTAKTVFVFDRVARGFNKASSLIEQFANQECTTIEQAVHYINIAVS